MPCFAGVIRGPASRHWCTLKLGVRGSPRTLPDLSPGSQTAQVCLGPHSCQQEARCGPGEEKCQDTDGYANEAHVVPGLESPHWVHAPASVSRTPVARSWNGLDWHTVAHTSQRGDCILCGVFVARRPEPSGSLGYHLEGVGHTDSLCWESKIPVLVQRRSCCFVGNREK